MPFILMIMIYFGLDSMTRSPKGRGSGLMGVVCLIQIGTRIIPVTVVVTSIVLSWLRRAALGGMIGIALICRTDYVNCRGRN